MPGLLVDMCLERLIKELPPGMQEHRLLVDTCLERLMEELFPSIQEPAGGYVFREAYGRVTPRYTGASPAGGYVFREAAPLGCD